MRGAICDTDHFMVKAKLLVSVRRKCRSNGVKVPKRIDVAKLKSPGVIESLQAAYNEVDFENLDWDGTREVLYTKGA